MEDGTTGMTEKMENKVEQNDFSIGAVFSHSRKILGTNPFVYLGLTVLAILPPVAILLFYAKTSLSIRAFSTGIVLAFVVYGFSFLLLLGAVTHAVHQNRSGRSASFVAALLGGLARLPMIFVTAFIMILSIVLIFILTSLLCGIAGLGGLGTLIALFVLLMLLVRWSVAIPVCAAEKLGPFKSITRSAVLTANCRLKIFAIFFLLSILQKFVEALCKAFVAQVGFSNIYYVALPVLLLMIPVATLQITIFAVTYFELRASKEGIAVDALTTVFD